jgi:hypothetical protein
MCYSGVRFQMSIGLEAEDRAFLCTAQVAITHSDGGRFMKGLGPLVAAAHHQKVTGTKRLLHQCVLPAWKACHRTVDRNVNKFDMEQNSK